MDDFHQADGSDGSPSQYHTARAPKIPRLIVGIDFGTTYSGVAFAFPSNVSEDPRNTAVSKLPNWRPKAVSRLAEDKPAKAPSDSSDKISEEPQSAPSTQDQDKPVVYSLKGSGKSYIVPSGTTRCHWNQDKNQGLEEFQGTRWLHGVPTDWGSKTASATMEEVFRNLLMQISTTLLTQARSIFSWILAARRPLSILELMELLALECNPTVAPITDQVHRHKLIERILNAGGGSLIVNKRQEVDFALDGLRQYILGGDTKFRISMASANEHVALSCLKYLAKGDIYRDISQGSSAPRVSAVRYMIKTWIPHYKYCEKRSRSVSGFLDNFVLNARSGNYSVWKEVYISSQPDGNAATCLETPLHLCATFGFECLAQLLLEAGDCPSKTAAARLASGGCEAYLTPIEVAVRNRHDGVVRLFLSCNTIQRVKHPHGPQNQVKGSSCLGEEIVNGQENETPNANDQSIASLNEPFATALRITEYQGPLPDLDSESQPSVPEDYSPMLHGICRRRRGNRSRRPIHLRRRKEMKRHLSSSKSFFHINEMSRHSGSK